MRLLSSLWSFLCLRHPPVEPGPDPLAEAARTHVRRNVAIATARQSEIDATQFAADAAALVSDSNNNPR